MPQARRKWRVSRGRSTPEFPIWILGVVLYDNSRGLQVAHRIYLQALSDFASVLEDFSIQSGQDVNVKSCERRVRSSLCDPAILVSQASLFICRTNEDLWPEVSLTEFHLVCLSLWLLRTAQTYRDKSLKSALGDYVRPSNWARVWSTKWFIPEDFALA
jgi:hypothetical protein